MSEYVPGLAGVVAARSKIGFVDGAAGELFYRATRSPRLPSIEFRGGRLLALGWEATNRCRARVVFDPAR